LSDKFKDILHEQMLSLIQDLSQPVKRTKPLGQPEREVTGKKVPLERIPRPDLQLETTTRLAKMVAAAEPGSRLPTERELCEQLGVGRSTLREAIRSLTFIGAIKSRQGDGRYVSKPDEQASDRLFGLGLLLQGVNIDDLIEARKSIEVEAARVAARRHTEADRNTLLQIMQAMRHSLSSADTQKAALYDMEYHAAIARATHNIVLIHLINGMQALLEIWMDKAVTRTRVWEEAVREHDALLEAILARDDDRAATCMREHLTRAAERVFSVVEANEATADHMRLFLARKHREPQC
jgi:GntR family transcriptional regulator, transcriptional repressor for pyruvate dehydrogenase complex